MIGVNPFELPVNVNGLLIGTLLGTNETIAMIAMNVTNELSGPTATAQDQILATKDRKRTVAISNVRVLIAIVILDATMVAATRFVFVSGFFYRHYALIYLIIMLANRVARTRIARRNGFTTALRLNTTRLNCEALTRRRTRAKQSKPRPRRRSASRLVVEKLMNHRPTGPLLVLVACCRRKKKSNPLNSKIGTLLVFYQLPINGKTESFCTSFQSLRRKSPANADKMDFNIEDFLKMDSDGLGLGSLAPSASEEVSRGSKASRWFSKASDQVEQAKPAEKSAPQTALSSKEDAARSLLEMMQKGSSQNAPEQHNKKVLTAEELERSAGTFFFLDNTIQILLA